LVVRRCRHNARPSSLEAIVRVALALAVLIAGHGFVPRAASPSGERFPCESCGCGCSSAQECWTNCCCYTPSERLAWAAAHRVEPPAAIRDSLLAQVIAVGQVPSPEPKAPACSCSESEPEGLPASDPASPTMIACECEARCSDCCSSDDLVASAGAPVSRHRTPAECKGTHTSSVAAPVVLLLAHDRQVVTLALDFTRCDSLGPIENIACPEITRVDTPEPPPRATVLSVPISVPT
jgi:hypothetical protein